MSLTPRIARRVAKDFPEDNAAVIELLDELVSSLSSGGPPERIAAAAVLHGQGKLDRLLEAVQTAYEDWRDVLMGTGLEHGDWPERMDREFGKE
ncbi:hypothetical protein [Streptomyces sp. DASNCL29]|uniref:hypothetical protein n=1 Tax=Streptomyces sp. DASNCL29 TaxID=2583819 RepID=UPI00110FBD4A|nr:hypothetical protein [Streptomyces sp. DASNCL29]TMU97820.1 hypothetical protein FGK60_08025 [Streptomyces sp. DASNCL29]